MAPGHKTVLVLDLQWPTLRYESCACCKWSGEESTALFLFAVSLRNPSLCSLPPRSSVLLSLPTDEALCYTSAFLQLARKGWESAEWLCNSALVYPDGFSVAEVISEWWMRFPLTTWSISWDASPGSFFSGHFSEHLSSCLTFLVSFDT